MKPTVRDMSTKHIATRYIRFATRERPTDRFLTAQIRESKDDDAPNVGDLYFVVEIHNPWFPNSQIGQTIINTVVREYRRGDSTSTLANFELALRKTNAVLAQITQTGETDWIGNLSSIILLVADGHVYLAQTGRAHAFLLREERVSEITEGLEEEATHHPLTTYTNITSGILEDADRVLIASSQIAETFMAKDIKTVLSDPSLREAGREFVRFLQTHRARRLNGFVIEANPPVETTSETIYTDETLNNFLDSTTRLIHHRVRPLLSQSAEAIRHQTGAAHVWARDWLIPRLIDWGGKTTQQLHQQAQRLATTARPSLEKTRQRAESLPPKGMRTPNADELQSKDLTGATIYRVHHYQERPESPVVPKAATAAFERLNKRFRSWLRRPPTGSIRLPVVSGRLRLSRSQLLLWGLAGLGIIIVVGSTLHRRAAHLNQTQHTAATDVLEQAQAAQKQADRAFILGDKQTARSAYTQAITLAKQANVNADTQAAAAAVISASQNVLDQLINATRVTPSDALTSFPQPVFQVTVSDAQLLSISNNQVFAISLPASSASSSVAPAATLPVTVSSTNAAVLLGDHWLIPTAGGGLDRYNLSSQAVDTINLPATWKAPVALSTYGNAVYSVDASVGQVWKYALQGTTLATPTGYLHTADPTGLKNVIGLAIDGDVYVLTTDGVVKKYSGGKPLDNWQLHGIPTPWDQILHPIGVYADPTANHLYVFEKKNVDRPARVLEFDTNGSFTRQLLLPDDWDVQSVSFSAKTATGAVVVGQKIYLISFPKS